MAHDALVLGLIPDSLGHLGLEEMLDTAVSLGAEAIELTTGNWSSAPHCDLAALLASEAARQRFTDALARRGLRISALNCSGNPLAYDADLQVTYDTFRLAELLEVERIVMMSGLPPGCDGDRTPVWVTTSWPPQTQQILDYQWDLAVPFWHELVRRAAEHGIERIALENHGWQLVYNPQTLLRLRAEVGPMIGMNLDPSHLFWMGGDPIAAVRALGDALYHLHVKDSRLERGRVEADGVLDTRTIDEFAARAWNYVAVGCGHGLQWWQEFFSVVRMSGYAGPVSIEMEDLTMDALSGLRISFDTARRALGQ